MRRFILAALVVGVLVGADKDKKDKGSNEVNGVVGLVLLDGEPLAKATVIFVPLEKGGQKATATTNEKGVFAFAIQKKKERGKEGILPGKYKIVVTKEVSGKSVLPAKYGSEKTTPFTLEVVAGVGNRPLLSLKTK
jgi:hypothetical protein